MQGTVELESEVGVGSTFSFTIPFAISASCEDDNQSSLGKRRAELSGTILPSEAKILVAEDHPLNQAYIKLLLAKYGFVDIDLRENGKFPVVILVSGCDGAGKGATFTVTLPLAAASDAADSPAMQSSGEGSAQAKRILLVEDNHVNQKVVQAILRKKGYHVDVANHGREALEYLELLAYNIVLMDVQMPILDGLETTRAIRADARFRKLPIVAMTAHAMSGDREKCLKAGMDDYITKPIKEDELKKFLDKYNIVVSIGSAFNTSSPKASHVLEAIRAPPVIKRGIIRISFGDHNTKSEVKKFVKVLIEAIKKQTADIV